MTDYQRAVDRLSPLDTSPEPRRLREAVLAAILIALSCWAAYEVRPVYPADRMMAEHTVTVSVADGKECVGE